MIRGQRSPKEAVRQLEQQMYWPETPLRIGGAPIERRIVFPRDWQV